MSLLSTSVVGMEKEEKVYKACFNLCFMNRETEKNCLITQGRKADRGRDRPRSRLPDAVCTA